VAFTEIPISALRNHCRERIETLELWLRRVIHDKLLAQFGDDYFEKSLNGNQLFNTEIRKKSVSRMTSNPGRYSRPLDSLVLDDLITTLCKPELHRGFFQDTLKSAFPDGAAEARTFLARIVDIRNSLAHANPISDHDALRVFCYSQDIISSIRQHYLEASVKNEFNAPIFVRFTDSLGHSEAISPQTTGNASFNYPDCILYPGERLRLEVSVDDSFNSESYQVTWHVANISGGETSVGSHWDLLITTRHVGVIFTVAAVLQSNKDWHRHSNFDARLSVSYKVLPPS
jgi:hypothetical protein